MSNNIFSKLKTLTQKLLFPDNIKCIFCNCDISDFDNKPYCDDCEKTLPFNNKNKCKICDEPILNETSVCNHCQNTKLYFHKIYCPFIYEGKIRNTLIAFKSDNKKYLAKPLAKMLADYIGNSINSFDFITFVPMTEKRKKQRGYNQAELLANELSKIANIPVVETIIKEQETTSQKELNFKERTENLKSCFKIKDKNFIKDKNIILIDDIVTTSATVNACCELLSKHANQISVGAIARTLLKNQ